MKEGERNLLLSGCGKHAIVVIHSICRVGRPSLQWEREKKKKRRAEEAGNRREGGSPWVWALAMRNHHCCFCFCFCFSCCSSALEWAAEDNRGMHGSAFWEYSLLGGFFATASRKRGERTAAGEKTDGSFCGMSFFFFLFFGKTLWPARGRRVNGLDCEWERVKWAKV
jgi:hypothetical protein